MSYSTKLPALLPLNHREYIPCLLDGTPDLSFQEVKPSAILTPSLRWGHVSLATWFALHASEYLSDDFVHDNPLGFFWDSLLEIAVKFVDYEPWFPLCDIQNAMRIVTADIDKLSDKQKTNGFILYTNGWELSTLMINLDGAKQLADTHGNSYVAVSFVSWLENEIIPELYDIIGKPRLAG